MPHRVTTEELMRLLKTDQHAQILGIREDTRIEFKSQVNLGLNQDKQRLAISVAALANTSGGIIVVGVQTARDVQSRLDYAAELTYAGHVDIGSFHNVFSTYLYPRPKIQIELFGKGTETLLAINVEQVTVQRPVLVTQSISENLNGGSIFGLYTRTEEGKSPVGYAEIHALLQTAERLSGVGELNGLLELIHSRLSSIESRLARKGETHADD